MNVSTQPPVDLVGLVPLAPAVGPFPLDPFVTAVSGSTGDEVIILGDHGSRLPISISGDTVRVAGDSDLTDYHSPLGDRLEPVVTQLAGLVADGHRLDLDSIPTGVAELMAEQLSETGALVVIEDHTVTAVVDLPDTFDDYLGSLSKKQRHEVRRKRHRYEELVGELIHETHVGQGWGLSEFFRLHPLSRGEKGTFMTSEHRKLFLDLAGTPGWRVDLLRLPDTDCAAAAVFSYADADGVYLYNSCYDPDLSEASPGIAMVGSLIEQAIVERFPRFDFLKGDEIYKFRLGATPRQLMRIRTGVADA